MKTKFITITVEYVVYGKFEMEVPDCISDSNVAAYSQSIIEHNGCPEDSPVFKTTYRDVSIDVESIRHGGLHVVS